MKIICKRNYGYKWLETREGLFKGYIQDVNEEVYRGENAIRYFARARNFDEFIGLLKEVQGNFAIILKRESIWAAVDIERTIPLYYSVDLRILSDDAEEIRKKKKISKDKINIMQCLELYGSTYISDENTIYDEIKQIDYRNAIEISDNNIRKIVYYKTEARVRRWDRIKALKELSESADNTIRRIMKVVGDRTVVLSLSGGYDSRFLACELKKNGVKNVICVAYGDKNSFELGVSKRVADALGYEWHCVEYSDADVKSIISEKNSEFLEYAIEHDFTIYLQNFAAIKKMKEQKIIPEPESAVFLVGLINDVTVGHYVPTKEKAEKYGFNNKGFVEFVLDDRFARFILTAEARSILGKNVEEKIKLLNVNITDYQSFVTAWDDINLGYGHSRNYPKMNANHEFFGYEWLLPCMDKELLAFWRSVPADMRVYYNLFEEYVTEVIGKEYGVGQKKIIIEGAKQSFMGRLKRYVGGLVVRIAFPLGIPLRRKSDINNFAPLEVALYKGIKQKKAVKASRAGIRLLMDVYFMEKRYGTKWYRQISSMIRK